MTLRSSDSKKKAFALITVLLMSSILLVMMLALFQALRAGKGNSQFHFQRVAARQAAEAGLVDAIAQLRIAPDWTAGFNQKPMADVEGSYSVIFNQGTGPFDKDDSVNNHDGSHPDSYRGTGTVPSNTVRLVVIGKVGASTQRLEAVVGGTGGSVQADAALLTTGRIELHGSVDVSGMKAFDDETSVPALLHSNASGGGSDLIQWVPDGGTIEIDGEVSSSGTSPSAVDLNGYVPTGGTPSTGAAPQPMPAVDIPGLVTSQSSAPALSFPPTGSTSAPSGDSYYSGAAEIHGDLILNDSNLYIDGELKVNGSIRGNGSVYVTGKTTFRGDAEIHSQNRVSLFSQGSVGLFGFDGEAYLADRAAADASFQTLYDDLKWGLGEIETAVATGSAPSGYDVHPIGSVVSQVTSNGDSLIGGREGSTLYRMRDSLAGEAPGETRDFMVKRLEYLADFHAGSTARFGLNNNQAENLFLNDGSVKALFDVSRVLRPGAPQDVRTKVTALKILDEVGFDRLGASSFTGLVYTNGGFLADNQVIITGSVVVNDNGSQSSEDFDGQTVEAGDLILKGGTKLTYVEDLFGDDSGAGISGPHDVLIWIGQ